MTDRFHEVGVDSPQAARSLSSLVRAAITEQLHRGRQFCIFVLLTAVAIGLVPAFALGQWTGATTGTTNDAAHSYTRSADPPWAGGTVLDTFSPALTGAMTVYFGADYATTGTWNLTPSGNFDVTLQGGGTVDPSGIAIAAANRTVTLNGDIFVSNTTHNRTIVLGSTSNNNNLSVDLNAAPRTFTIERGDTLEIRNNLLGSSGLTIRGGNFRSLLTAGGNRLDNNLAISLDSGSLDLRAPGSGVQATETLGDIVYSGGSSLGSTFANNNNGPTTTLSIDSLQRSGRGTLGVFTANGAVNFALSSAAQQVQILSAPLRLLGGTKAMIAPHLFHSGDGAFLDYDGSKLVNAAFDVTATTDAALQGVSATDIVTTDATGTSLSLTGNASMLALRVRRPILNSGGTRTLTMGSGGLILLSPGNDGGGGSLYKLQPDLNFGLAEGIVVANSGNSSNGNWRLMGNITGSDGLTKTGDRPLVLSGSNDWTGGVEKPLAINGGQLRLSGGSFPATSTVHVAYGALFGLGNRSAGSSGGGDFGGISITTAGITGSGIIENGNNVAHTLTINNTNDFVFDGVLQNGLGGGVLNVIKDGAGKQTLTGASTYTGPTTINGGILQVDGSLTSNVAVNSGGTLGGNGSIAGSVTINADGNHSPGASVGSQSVGAEIWNPNGMFTFEINDATGGAGVGWDLVTASGLLGSGTLDISALTNANPFEIDIVSLAGSSPGAATNFDASQDYLWPFLSFDNLNGSFAADLFTLNATGFVNSIDGGSFSIVENGPTSLAIAFTANQNAAVPEPGSLVLWVLLGVSLVGLARRHRLNS